MHQFFVPVLLLKTLHLMGCGGIQSGKRGQLPPLTHCMFGLQCCLKPDTHRQTCAWMTLMKEDFMNSPESNQPA